MDEQAFRYQAGEGEETKNRKMNPFTQVVQSDASHCDPVFGSVPVFTTTLTEQDSSGFEERGLRAMYMKELECRSELQRLRKLREAVAYRNVFAGTQINPYVATATMGTPKIAPSPNIDMSNQFAEEPSIPILPQTLTGATAFPPGSNTPGHLLALRKCIADKETLLDMLRQERERREKLKKLQIHAHATPLACNYHDKGGARSLESLKMPNTFYQDTTGEAINPQALANESFGSWTLPVAIDVDKYVVSPYQQMLRDSLEFFVLQGSDQLSNSHGRDHGVQKGRVGIRCRFCKNRAFHWRGRGSVYFPGKMIGVYQAAQNIGTNHMLSSCSDIPDDRKAEMAVLRKTAVRRNGGGKRYWEECCRSAGIYEKEDKVGLWLKSSGKVK